ncbi:MAG: 30S ribosomal protein S12 methylthiotransferase RimO [Spirochaetes bacterium]|nr:MAG: 30S ribosomal protein S12 methylthiotransferase RimO [Spirochaetota bacterium]
MNKPTSTTSSLYPCTDKSFYIENLGCAKNQVDAELIIASLESSGWSYLPDPKIAELIIVNTCGFIDAAKEESIQTIFSLRQQYPDKKIVIAGCLSQRYGTSLKGLLPEVNGIFGNRAPWKIKEIIGENSIESAFFPPPVPDEEKGIPLRKTLLSFPGSAYVKISEGCNNFCSYCSIPRIRGTLRSRTVESVLEEIKRLISDGIFEINLIAQDLGSFGTDRGIAELSLLLNSISDLEGDFWIRLLYIHPDHFPLEILDICRRDKRILPYFDLPFQHASKKVLTRMNRKGDVETYLKLIEKIRNSLPDAIIRSTFLVGFPGEGKKDFESLLSFQEKAQIDWLGVFTYSREESTPAYRYRGGIAHRFYHPVAVKRKELLEKKQCAITIKRLKRFLGKRLRVLIEEEIEGEKLYLGRAYIHAPDVDGLIVAQTPEKVKLTPGTLIECMVRNVRGVDLIADTLFMK